MAEDSQIAKFRDAYSAVIRKRLEAEGLVDLTDAERSHYVQVLKEMLEAEREAIKAIHLGGAGGAEVVYRTTAWTDALLIELFHGARQLCGWTEAEVPSVLLAIGGYGRGELNPYSDLDVMFLTDKRIEVGSRELSECCLYLMWDLNLDIGHSIRSIPDCLTLAASDVQAKTSLIESRYLAGNRSVYDRFLKEALVKILHRDAAGYLKVKIGEVGERHKKFGGSLYMKEPHIKEGVGGLRDIHTAFWSAKVKYEVESLGALKERGVISEKEGEILRHALEFLWKVRNHLHYLSGRRSDRLTVDVQEDVASYFKYRDLKHLLGVERFMRVYYLHAKNVRYFTGLIINRCAPSPAKRFFLFPHRIKKVGGGFSIAGEQLCVPEKRKNFFREDPHRLIQVFALAQRYAIPIADGTKQQIVASLRLVNDGFRSSDAVRETFMQILCAANGVVEVLRQMHEVRFLGKYIPEFGALTALVQHELYHVYTVDEHTLNALEYLERLHGTPYPEDRFYAELLRKVSNREVLYLALLLHDIGRAMGHGHVNRGGKAVAVITHRMGLSKETGKTIEFLVRNHLVMTHLSQRRDIHDFKLVAQLARAVGNADQLRMLTLLTYGDIRGVGPAVWNEWKDTLLRELFIRTEKQLVSPSVEAATEALSAHLERIQERIAEEGAALFGEDETARIVRTLPDHYLLSTPHGMVMTHLAMIREAESAGLVTRWKHDPDRGYSELYICAYDSDAPGFFSRIAAVLAARGINILGARIFTTTQGIVIDTIQIESPGETERADWAYWQDVARSIRSVIQGVDRVEKILVEHRPPSYLRKRRGRKLPTRIEFDNAVSESRTVIDVSTEDRIGLLFRVTSCLAQQGVQIHSAKVATEEDRAIDAFYVTDIFGLKITDEPKLAAIKTALLDSLKGEGP